MVFHVRQNNYNPKFHFMGTLRTKFDVLFKTAKSVEIVVILGKQLFYSKILVSCKHSTLFPPMFTSIYRKAIFFSVN